MHNTDDDFTMDCEWYAVDNDSNIGFFTTGGSNFYPEAFHKYPGILQQMHSTFFNLPDICEYQVNVNNWGKIDSWTKKSKCGLYGYDFDVTFQVGNVVSLIIKANSQLLIESLKPGVILSRMQCYSSLSLFNCTGIVSGKSKILSGPKKGYYSIDITIDIE